MRFGLQKKAHEPKDGPQDSTAKTSGRSDCRAQVVYKSASPGMGETPRGTPGVAANAATSGTNPSLGVSKNAKADAAAKPGPPQAKSDDLKSSTVARVEYIKKTAADK